MLAFNVLQTVKSLRPGDRRGGLTRQ